jgi:hypothetical protein
MRGKANMTSNLRSQIQPDLNRYAVWLALGWALLVPLLATASAQEASWIDQSRLAARDFSSSLRRRLQEGLQQGPEQAIEICHHEASVIAQQTGTRYDRLVSRSSDRVRNSANQPDTLDQKIMESFRARLATGESAAALEFIEDRGEAGTTFAKPLMMDAVCLLCHGENLAPNIAASIDRYYPDDQATGFKLGELRGILRVDQMKN